jgi:hypothetical protein
MIVASGCPQWRHSAHSALAAASTALRHGQNLQALGCELPSDDGRATEGSGKGAVWLQLLLTGRQGCRQRAARLLLASACTAPDLREALLPLAPHLQHACKREL